MILINISLMVSNTEHFLKCPLSIYMSSWKNVYQGPLPVALLGYE